jgi:hypothetical protein
MGSVMRCSLAGRAGLLRKSQIGSFSPTRSREQSPNLISTVSAAVRARDRGHVSCQCETHEKNRPNFEEVRGASRDRLSGLALKEVRTDLWPDIEDLGAELLGKI